MNIYSNQLFPISQTKMSDQEVLIEIARLKNKLADQVVILGHHYQRESVIQFADVRGDSLILAQKAAESNRQYIVFCGVHFMAETADILTRSDQKIILPDMEAGCSMADMATKSDIEIAWNYIASVTDEKVVPVTYINSTAEVKAFVGEHDGSICTSSNAKKVVSWALENGGKLMFFPDQHLGRNTCFQLGIGLNQMVTYDPFVLNGGLFKDQIKNARVILWNGECCVHQEFTTKQIERVRMLDPKAKVIVHPECPLEVVQASDLNGSTSYIIDQIEKAPAGSTFYVGTEASLVQRLGNEQQKNNKKIFSLSENLSVCSTMFLITPRHLLSVLKSIELGKPGNIVEVDSRTAASARKALNRMFA